MMEIYSSNTSEIVRYDFLKYSRRRSETHRKAETEEGVSEEIRRSFDEYRAGMANDDSESIPAAGLSSKEIDALRT